MPIGHLSPSSSLRIPRLAVLAASFGCAPGALAAQAPWLPHPPAPSCDDRQIADLDGDGDLDCVSTLEQVGVFGVSFGDGLGGFAPQLYTAVSMPIPTDACVRCADFDLDGDVDVATSDRIDWNDGSGGFASHAPVAWGPSVPHDLFHVADLDGSGTPDLAAQTGAQITVLPLLAGAAIGAPISSAGGGVWFDPVLCDANGDGVLDFVTGSPAQVSVHVNLGNGLFSPEQPLIATPGVRKLAAADLDQNGEVDLCTFTGTSTDLVSVWLQQAGSFSLAQGFHYPLGGERQMELADIDVDGRLDLLLHDWTRYVHRLPGLPSAQFGAGVPSYLGAASRGFRLGDIDGDGWPDIAGSGWSSGGFQPQVYWCFGGPSGFGGTHVSAVSTIGYYPLAGHFAAGGGIDVASEIQAATTARLDWVRVDASGAFLPLGSTPVAQALSARLAAVDHDGDGRHSVVRAASQVALEFYDGPSASGPQLSVPIIENVWSVEPADFDADGSEDFVVCGFQSGAVPVRFTPTGWVGLPAVVTSPAGESARVVAVGQIDGSGAPDLVAVHDSGAVTWCAGNGDGTFGAPAPFATVGQAQAVELFDIDADGRLDVHVQSNQAGGTLFSFAQPGGTYVTTPAVIGCGVWFRFADIDLDGRVDLVTSGPATDALVVRRGTGTAGGFVPIPQEVFFGGGEADMKGVLAAEDLDGDGRVDLLLASFNRLGLMLHRDYATPGTQAIGTGTSGCAGAHAWEALTQPIVGNAAFALRGDAAPAHGIGLALISAQADAQGSDPFQLGPLFHVGLAGVFVTGVQADAAGVATKPAPVPNDPALVATQLSTQVVWAWTSGPCAPTQPLGLSSSPGLTLTFLP